MAGKYKEIEIFHEPTDPLYQLKFKGGGQLPEMLKGKFTSRLEAERMRDLYYNDKLPKQVDTIRSSKVDKEK